MGRSAIRRRQSCRRLTTWTAVVASFAAVPSARLGDVDELAEPVRRVVAVRALVVERGRGGRRTLPSGGSVTNRAPLRRVRRTVTRWSRRRRNGEHQQLRGRGAGEQPLDSLAGELEPLDEEAGFVHGPRARPHREFPLAPFDLEPRFGERAPVVRRVAFRSTGSVWGESGMGSQGREDPVLTPAERRVLELVAGGLSNAEIAEQLFLVEQTVKFHLSRIYRRPQPGRCRATAVADLGGRHRRLTSYRRTDGLRGIARQSLPRGSLSRRHV
jgi:hypothetical protein